MLSDDKLAAFRSAAYDATKALCNAVDDPGLGVVIIVHDGATVYTHSNMGDDETNAIIKGVASWTATTQN